MLNKYKDIPSFDTILTDKELNFFEKQDLEKCNRFVVEDIVKGLKECGVTITELQEQILSRLLYLARDQTRERNARSDGWTKITRSEISKIDNTYKQIKISHESLLGTTPLILNIKKINGEIYWMPLKAKRRYYHKENFIDEWYQPIK